MIQLWPGIRDNFTTSNTFMPQNGNKMELSETKESLYLWKWFLLQGMHTFDRNTLYIFIYAKYFIEKMKGFILFENQVISNTNDKQYLDKVYSLPNEFSYHLEHYFLCGPECFLYYMYISFDLLTHL